jgi:hypothetical protein
MSLLLTLAIIGIAVASVPARAQVTTADTTKYTFADLAWGSNGATVKAALQRAGYEFIKVDQDGDYSFKGKVLGYPARVFVFMDPKGRATKVQATLITPDDEARSVFAKMKDLLVQKYGKPDQSYDFFESPYYEGDGYEDQAISVGKGHFLAFWGESTPGAGNVMDVAISKKLVVNVSYEGYGWHAEIERREAKATRAF